MVIANLLEKEVQTVVANQVMVIANLLEKEVQTVVANQVMVIANLLVKNLKTVSTKKAKNPIATIRQIGKIKVKLKIDPTNQEMIQRAKEIKVNPLVLKNGILLKVMTLQRKRVIKEVVMENLERNQKVHGAISPNRKEKATAAGPVPESQELIEKKIFRI
jgi:hypothetical protein